MKRDMDLIKSIMLKLEQDDFGDTVEGYTKEQVLFHKKLLVEAGFLSGKAYNNTESSIPKVEAVIIKDITWQGYDFLELLQDDKKFAFLKDVGKTLSMEALKYGMSAAKEYAINALG